MFFKTYLFKNGEKKINNSIKNNTPITKGLLLMIGFIGGVFTSVLGTGADIIAFSIITILFQVNEKILNPTSDIIMALVSVMGLLMRLFFFGGMNKEAAASFPLAIPVVIIMAPLGAIMANKIKRLTIVKFLLFFIVIDVISTFRTVHLSNTGIMLTISGFVILLLFYFLLARISKYINRMGERYMTNKSYFISESVMAGHPDKMCDQISDAILDKIIEQDPLAHVACETIATEDLVMVTGEITANASVNYEMIVRDTVKEIGYSNDLFGFNGDSCKVLLILKEQSQDIAMGVNQGRVTGAGDQGMMFGYACNETDELMPLSLTLAHELVRELDEYRKKYPELLGPDGKSQVTVEYEEGKIRKVDTIVVSIQHAKSLDLEDLKKMITEHVIMKVIPKELLKNSTKIYINPTGRFVEGGPKADAGLTGRKIIVDTYGGYSSHGGGAFSGKDPTKVDRTGAYMARYIAKNIVAAGLADKCQIELAYAIGREQPVSVYVDCFQTSKLEEKELIQIIKNEFELTPAGMIDQMDLRRPIYRKTSVYGHFGRNGTDYPWEKTDKVEQLKTYRK